MSTSKTRGPGQNKRFWTEEEDKQLIEALIELHSEGKFKSEGGFKPGHLKALEIKLHDRLPGSNLQGKPHIESRMKTLKTHFQVVHDMLTGPYCSGFGWDNERKIVTVEQPVWDAYLQVYIKPSITYCLLVYIANYIVFSLSCFHICRVTKMLHHLRQNHSLFMMICV